MTNLEYMRKKMVETVMELDEIELLQVAEDAEMTLKETEGVFNCLICERRMGNVAAALVQKNIVIDYFCAGVQKNMSIKTIRKGKRNEYKEAGGRTYNSVYCFLQCGNEESK